MKIVRTKEGISYFWPFVLVTSLFFLWGFAHSILDVLNTHFQEVLVISKAKSALIQAVVYRITSYNVCYTKLLRDAVMQAKENVEKSPWAHRIAVEQHDFTSYQAGALYDTIVCNPPYFIDSLKSPDKKRTTARHTDELTYEDLFKSYNFV